MRPARLNPKPVTDTAAHADKAGCRLRTHAGMRASGNVNLVPTPRAAYSKG
ncbi:MAG: hypothetical protein AAFU86_12830 [Pseudomonadota bacterium]